MVVSANLVGSILSFGLVFKYYLDSWVMPDLKLWRKVLLYSTPLTLVAMAGVFNQYFGIYLVKIFSAAGLEGSAESGLYGAVLRVSILMSLFTTAFKFAAEPFFFKNMSSEEAPFLYARIANVFTFVGCLIMLGILMNIDLIQYLIGQNFRAGLSILPILLLAYLLLGIYTNFAIWYKIKDLTIYGTAISLVGSVVFV
jgi:Polysaccharide biosynthesis protein.